MEIFQEGDARYEINLDEFLKANESRIRWHVDSLVRERAAQAIGRENLAKVTLTLWGDSLDDLAVQVEGPDELKAKIEQAFRNN